MDGKDRRDSVRVTHGSKQTSSLELKNIMQDRAIITFCLTMGCVRLLFYVDLSYHILLLSVSKIIFHSLNSTR